MIIECEKCKAAFDDGGTGGAAFCPECGSAVASGTTGADAGSKGTLFDEIRSEVMGEIDPDGIEPGPRAGKGPEAAPGAGAAGSVAGDGGNWEEFVNISKTGTVAEDFKVSIEDAFKERDSEFNWENLKIDREGPEPPAREPRLFEDEEPEEEEEIPLGRGPGPGPVGQAAAPGGAKEDPRDTRGDALFLNMDALSHNEYQSEIPPAQAAGPRQDSGRVYRPKPGKRGGFWTTCAYALLSLIILAVILGASYVILLNTGYVPPQLAARVEGTVKSLVPGMLAGPAKNGVVITEHRGRWLNTRNGPLYVISGKITNRSDSAVSYVKIESEFISAGQVLYDDTVYAGNTFTEGELRGLPLQDILSRLKKKTGNIDFYNTEKLGGLNFDVRPGESVPFYAVFPPSGKVLGLKYNLGIVDYETPLSD
ncbi:MAG: hypothetical protein IT344_05620 [Candidatus Dadabacteria bacterium]|nr:hypothetical protein [Candidatus Dadabacteria bacterium]